MWDSTSSCSGPSMSNIYLFLNIFSDNYVEVFGWRSSWINMWHKLILMIRIITANMITAFLIAIQPVLISLQLSERKAACLFSVCGF